MKNMKKFAAGFIAAAMAMSMSLSAFAEVVDPSLSQDKATLNLNITSADEAQITMMAYVVEGTDWTVETAPAYSNQEIVALDQEVGSTGFATIPVDPAKLEDGNTIVVKIGGSAGNVATYLITMEEQIVTYSVTYELAGGTVTNAGANTFDADDTIADFFAALEDPAKAATESETYTFAGWSKTADGEVIDETSTALMTTLLDEGATSITLYAKYTGTPVTQPVIVVMGDVDGDGEITTTDASLIKLYVAAANKDDYNTSKGTEIGVEIVTDVKYGDVDGDKEITTTDASLVKLYVGAANKDDYNTSKGTEIGETKTYN